MTTRHLVDPELLPGLDLIPTLTFSAETLPAIRQQFGSGSGSLPEPASEAVVREQLTIPGSEGHDIPLIIYRPKELAAQAPVVLYMHGGGYILGSAASMLGANESLAVEVNCLLAAVDYRLAPETCHPGPVEDCYAALKWLHDNALALGVDSTRIAVAGESAGAGLAAALALLARDRGEIPIIHQHLIYPMLDDRTNRTNANPLAGEFVWSPESNVFGWSSLLGCPAGGDGISPYAAAARAEDLTGLPSTFISVGALDLFAEEDMEFARRLMRAGVATELHVYPGAYHGFEIAGDAAVTRKAHHNSVSALKRALYL